MSIKETIEKLQELLQFGRNPDGITIIPEIRCADGIHFSMQAGRTHYCRPRDNSGPWALVEIGYPSLKIEEFMPFIDGQDSEPSDTVYGYVPIETIAQVVVEHGGLVFADPLEGGKS